MLHAVLVVDFDICSFLVGLLFLVSRWALSFKFELVHPLGLCACNFIFVIFGLMKYS